MTKQNNKKTWITVALIIGIIIIAAIVVWCWINIQLLGTEKKVAKLGIKLTPEKIERLNFTASYQKLAETLELLKQPTKDELQLLPKSGFGGVSFLDRSLNSEQQKIVSNYIDRNMASFEAIEKAIPPINSVGEHNLEEFNPKEILNICGKVMQGNRIFADAVEAAIINHSSSNAISFLKAGFRLSDYFNIQKHYLNNFLFNLSTTIWLTNINRVVNNFKLSDAELQEIIDLMHRREAQIKENFSSMLAGEAFIYCSLIDKRQPIIAGKQPFWTKLDTSNTISSESMFMPWWWLIGSALEKQAMLEDILYIKEKLINLDNYSAIKSDWETFDLHRNARFFSPFSKEYIDFHYIFKQNINSIAYLRCAEVALTTILYQRKYGKIPPKIAVLSPDFLNEKDLIDPWIGKFLIMKYGRQKVRLSTQYISNKNVVEYAERVCLKVYSVGPNLNDNEGSDVSGTNSGGTNDDPTFILIDQNNAK